MIKALIIATTIAMAPIPTQAQVTEVLCPQISEMVLNMGMARDAGIPLIVMQRMVVNTDQNPEFIAFVISMLNEVYDNPHITPIVLAAVAHDSCLRSYQSY